MMRRTLHDSPLPSDRGFTVVEMLIATTIMVLVTGAIFGMMNPAQGTFQAQPEVSDMQQRLRIGADSLYKDLIMAGAGTYSGASAGALFNVLAPVVPYRAGDVTPAVGTFRDDTISLLYVPATPSQTTLNANLANTGSTSIQVKAQANCPQGNASCGFTAGTRALLFDQLGNFDPVQVTAISGQTLTIAYNGPLSVAYKADSTVTQIATHTYYLKTDTTTNTYQLMHYDGYQSDVPVVDNVVDLKFEYYGDPAPPRLLPNKPLTDTKGPWTTYGPKPPVLGTQNAPWPAGENCVFQVVGGQHSPRLATLAAGVAQVKLDSAIFTDGPWCPDGAKQERFDADLLRVRRIRVTLRVQAAVAAMRGTTSMLIDGRPLFKRGGTMSSSQRFVPDQEVRFDVAPRNMNLGR